jgi:DNA-binding beta-propeller fold protein YncE
MKKNLAFVLVALLGACGGGGGGNNGDDVQPGDDQPGIDGGSGSGSDGGIQCVDHGVAAPADRTRYVVVAHPFAADFGGGAPLFEVLTLSQTGELSQAANKRTFELAGRASYGNIAFTPDGQIGLVALSEIGQAVPGGKVGVFFLAPDGTPTVIDAGFSGDFYAGAVVMDPSGKRAYILDQETRNNGGGIHAVDIACDGHLTDKGLIAPAKLPGGLVLDGDRALVMAGDYGPDEVAGKDAHLLAWNPTAPTRTFGIDAYGDDNVDTPNAALTHDKATYIALNNALSGGNRVAILGVGTSDLTVKTVLTGIVDPQGVATSPFGNVAIVSAFQDDAIYILDDQGTAGAWRKRGTVTPTSTVQQPSDIVSIDRGTLMGHLWVVENTLIRHLEFTNAGTVTDHGTMKFEGDGGDTIPGAIGIQP